MVLPACFHPLQRSCKDRKSCSILWVLCSFFGDAPLRIVGYLVNHKICQVRKDRILRSLSRGGIWVYSRLAAGSNRFYGADCLQCPGRASEEFGTGAIFSSGLSRHRVLDALRPQGAISDGTSNDRKMVAATV